MLGGVVHTSGAGNHQGKMTNRAATHAARSIAAGMRTHGRCQRLSAANPEQALFLPYLQGYVAFYAGDYKTALQELLKANQNDPFIQCMIGQTYEKLADREKSLEYYRKAAAAISHNPTAAYAVPFAKKKLTLSPS
jgi:tetratricopeptide (TPR) repeat protein